MTKKTTLDSLGRISRRDFTRRAALAAATAAALPADLLAQPAPTLLPAPQAGANEPKLAPESQAEVDSKIQIILHKYGDRLSEEQQKDIRRLVTEGQKPLEALRAYKIDNSDQPATVLKIYPEVPVSRRTTSAGAAGRREKE